MVSALAVVASRVRDPLLLIHHPSEWLEPGEFRGAHYTSTARLGGIIIWFHFSAFFSDLPATAFLVI